MIEGHTEIAELTNGGITMADRINDDTLNPICCKRCHKKIPQAKLSREGYCYVCVEATCRAQRKTAVAVPVREVGNVEEKIVRCPRCGSREVIGDKRGYSVGGGLSGAMILGPLGLLAGSLNSNEFRIRCLYCGAIWDPTERRPPEAVEAIVGLVIFLIITIAGCIWICSQ